MKNVDVMGRIKWFEIQGKVNWNLKKILENLESSLYIFLCCYELTNYLSKLEKLVCNRLLTLQETLNIVREVGGGGN